ncbi:MAG: hypothetical protein MI923_13595, partial [Phycisphaerales bacterium]|nr:hypothetical protein [Phycisphaerales bacterium]
NRSRYYVHGISFVDERLMMYSEEADRPYYYTIDRMYNVRSVVDRAGAVVERYAYNPYGRPQIRQSAGRGDMDNNTDITGADTTRYSGVQSGSGWDPRADMNDDGSVNGLDNSAYGAALAAWKETNPQVGWAFSRVDNPFMFQGRPHMAIDSLATARGEGKLMLNDHRARFGNPVVGRWLTRDPLEYREKAFLLLTPMNPELHITNGVLISVKMLDSRRKALYTMMLSNALRYLDPTGLIETLPADEDWTSHIVCDGNGGFMMNEFERPEDPCKEEAWEAHEQQHIDDLLAGSWHFLCWGQPAGTALGNRTYQDAAEWECSAWEAEVIVLEGMDVDGRCCDLVNDCLSFWQDRVDDCYDLGVLPRPQERCATCQPYYPDNNILP